jgi:hypothetical protein
MRTKDVVNCLADTLEDGCYAYNEDGFREQIVGAEKSSVGVRIRFRGDDVF